MIACMAGSEEAANVLIDYGADVNLMGRVRLYHFDSYFMMYTIFMMYMYVCV